MILKEILEIYEILDRPGKVGNLVGKLFSDTEVECEIKEVKGKNGSTEFIKILIPGKKGKSAGGNNPTLGITGYLGGIGARPGILGFASDGDGALTALSCAL